MTIDKNTVPRSTELFTPSPDRKSPNNREQPGHRLHVLRIKVDSISLKLREAKPSILPQDQETRDNLLRKAADNFIHLSGLLDTALTVIQDGARADGPVAAQIKRFRSEGALDRLLKKMKTISATTYEYLGRDPYLTRTDVSPNVAPEQRSRPLNSLLQRLAENSKFAGLATVFMVGFMTTGGVSATEAANGNFDPENENVFTRDAIRQEANVDFAAQLDALNVEINAVLENFTQNSSDLLALQSEINATQNEKEGAIDENPVKLIEPATVTADVSPYFYELFAQHTGAFTYSLRVNPSTGNQLTFTDANGTVLSAEELLIDPESAFFSFLSLPIEDMIVHSPNQAQNLVIRGENADGTINVVASWEVATVIEYTVNGQAQQLPIGTVIDYDTPAANGSRSRASETHIYIPDAATVTPDGSSAEITISHFRIQDIREILSQYPSLNGVELPADGAIVVLQVTSLTRPDGSKINHPSKIFLEAGNIDIDYTNTNQELAVEPRYIATPRTAGTRINVRRGPGTNFDIYTVLGSTADSDLATPVPASINSSELEILTANLAEIRAANPNLENFILRLDDSGLYYVVTDGNITWMPVIINPGSVSFSVADDIFFVSADLVSVNPLDDFEVEAPPILSLPEIEEIQPFGFEGDAVEVTVINPTNTPLTTPRLSPGMDALNPRLRQVSEAVGRFEELMLQDNQETLSQGLPIEEVQFILDDDGQNIPLGVYDEFMFPMNVRESGTRRAYTIAATLRRQEINYLTRDGFNSDTLVVLIDTLTDRLFFDIALEDEEVPYVFTVQRGQPLSTMQRENVTGRELVEMIRGLPEGTGILLGIFPILDGPLGLEFQLHQDQLYQALMTGVYSNQAGIRDNPPAILIQVG